ncbi:MAG: hypothetical protein AAGG02_10190 [Cyanobacteria bacterium P01_H01_bin.15]
MFVDLVEKSVLVFEVCDRKIAQALRVSLVRSNHWPSENLADDDFGFMGPWMAATFILKRLDIYKLHLTVDS